MVVDLVNFHGMQTTNLWTRKKSDKNSKAKNMHSTVQQALRIKGNHVYAHPETITVTIHKIYPELLHKKYCPYSSQSWSYARSSLTINQEWLVCNLERISSTTHTGGLTLTLTYDPCDCTQWRQRCMTPGGGGGWGWASNGTHHHINASFCWWLPHINHNWHPFALVKALNKPPLGWGPWAAWSQFTHHPFQTIYVASYWTLHGSLKDVFEPETEISLNYKKKCKGRKLHQIAKIAVLYYSTKQKQKM